MTNETELRDRIAAAIWSNEQKKPGLADTEPHPDCYDMAQAVIDDLSLTVKMVQFPGRRKHGDGWVITPGTLEPIIKGRWGKQ